MTHDLEVEKERRAQEIAFALMPYADGEKLTKAAIVDLRKQLGLSRATIFKKLRTLRRHGTVSSLIPLKPGRRPLSRFLSPLHEKIIEKKILKSFLSQDHISPHALYKWIIGELQSRGLEPVDKSTLLSRIHEIEPRKVVAKQKGMAQARTEFDLVKDHFVADHPLQCVQIDHTRADIILVDPVTGEPIGRPLLTICLDVHTRMLVGLTLSMTTLSAHALARVFYDAVMPKQKRLEELKLSVRWPCFGLPEIVHSDNGSDLVSNAFEAGLEDNVIKHWKRPVRTPRYGGHIERMFRTLNNYIHSLPGSTLSDTKKLDGRKPEHAACLTLNQFERLLVSYVCNVYHKEKHSGLHDTPENVWDRWWRARDAQPILPRDAERFRLSFLPHKTGAIGKDGVTFNHLKFRSRTLQRMRNCGVRSVRYHYDPEDIRKIYGCDDKGGIFEIPCVKSFHQKISLSEWGEMHEEIAQNGSRYTDADLARQYQLHDEILGQGAKLRTKRRKSKRLSKRGSKPIPAPFAALKPSALTRRFGQDGEGSDA
ncbi:Mu transposase C-terminal domain-containing protein [Aliiroseovarius sp. F20344]|uniref:Mu transposase C-terminal domain-containing protein n=1 Tax=Aliiroseovarius sp. F20344 TaxID=2926414 RepID=UPI001FF443E6|nr:Mu transposase C-terminal domain-containing protein [Aliiroseovarius sp. F20344]MCK0143634.1 DDE-type integrase/transposase/recombinase [Aliiroseovarius sp. F20344]